MSEQFNINKLTDHLFRREAGKMSAILIKIFGTENLQLSEDVIQETFINAMRVWSLNGIPDSPSAWLMRAAKNKAIDFIRKNKFSRSIDFSDPERMLLQSEYTLTSTIDKLWNEDEITDDLLRMMFACCHEELSEENQITLMLKILCGFSTAEIAKAFVTSEDTVSKRLYRAKEFFRTKKIKPEFPPASHLKDKTGTVLRTIYLLFNEGYSSTHADKLIRKDLLDQSMYLCNLLCVHSSTQLPETFAAMALMCFHAARINSRIDEHHEIILLQNQDRGKWDRSLIDKGYDYLNKAAFGNEINSYHIEAAIAYEHCISPSFEQTNWKNILRYYDMLAAINPSSIVLLNRLTVIFKVYGAEQTLKEVEQALCNKEWQKNYLYHSLMGDVYACKDFNKAKAFYETAIGMTKSDAEKKLLNKKISQLALKT
ncbi:sigma-70 family RNA polymerase sigma factor [Danxiaibacter flavus]|uniref:Sigma-70 family RNA polymerase sigma factor n=1 Tax=Danxiaibacter flavus TaxID=3049108 RepID=A0ABV3ZCV7_9BACT|nr:sigma-70 family RNA polymerase sigma factor [Chitinophagaceae bacterium DXS]